MEESFEVRVKRLFGAQLFESVPRSSFPASSWSVSDGEVERNEWNRERGFSSDRSDDPCSTDFAEGGCYAKKRSHRRGFESESNELDDDSESECGIGVEEENEEESEIRSFVGLDPTLDREDEEDDFDRAAIGKDDAGERLYMKDVKNHGPHLNYHSIFADLEEEPYAGFDHLHKDPRADHFAAGMRLVEDNKAVDKFSMSNYGKDEHSFTSGLHDIELKPILKRKEAHNDSKPKKRVRFDSGCKIDNDEVLKEAQNSPMLLHSMYAPGATVPDLVILESSGLPDYMRNPSKYTHYTFDSYEDDDLANISAFKDFHDSSKKLNPEQLHQQVNVELPKSITFNPRRKLIDAIPVDNESGDVQENLIKKDLESDLCVTRSVGIAAGESFETGICKMDEDALEAPILEERLEPSKRERKYRCRATSDD